MASGWLDADVPALRRLAALQDRVASGVMAREVLSEIRQLEDRFGLSPLARARLQWEAETTPVGVDSAPAARDEARFLRAVGS